MGEFRGLMQKEISTKTPAFAVLNTLGKTLDLPESKLVTDAYHDPFGHWWAIRGNGSYEKSSNGRTGTFRRNLDCEKLLHRFHSDVYTSISCDGVLEAIVPLVCTFLR